jgi:hypothetical protein
MCFDSSACEVISATPGHHEHLNDAPIVPIAQQESSFLGPTIARHSRFAANVLPIIRDIQATGFTSFNAIAGQLNARKVATANGGLWRHVQARQILDRAASLVLGLGQSQAIHWQHPLAYAQEQVFPTFQLRWQRKLCFGEAEAKCGCSSID